MDTESKSQEYFEKIKSLRTPDEIKKLCDELTSTLFSSSNKVKTRLNKLTPYNKKINQYYQEHQDELVEGENAYIQIKNDGSQWKRHLHFKFTGIADTNWHGEGGINAKTTVTKRLENRHPINPEEYLKVASKLLWSHKPHELAVGLIAVSGRRPIEILARGSFKPEFEVPDYLTPDYFLRFKGQAKKRDYDAPEKEKVEYRIGCLVPSEFFIECFTLFRQMPETKEILELLETETKKGTSPEEINKMIDSRRNGSLIKVVKREFGHILPVRSHEEKLNNTSLRAAYVRLITKRDCPEDKTDLLWASRAIGHYIDEEKPDDSQLRNLLTTIRYFDYYVNDPVPFAPIPEDPSKKKLTNIKAYISDSNTLKELQKTWELSNQQEVVKKLIEIAMQAKDLKAQLLQAQNQLSESQVTHQQQSQEDVEAMVKRLVNQAIQDALPQIQHNQNVESQQVETQRQQPSKPVEPEKDWEEVPSEELRKSKVSGAADEKIRRSFVAITHYNDYTATTFEDKWVINNRALRDLSGCHGSLVSDWMKSHQIAIDDHNQKHGLTSYHNKRHKKPITEVLSW